MPSAKHSCSGSFDRFAKSRTTIDRRGGVDGVAGLSSPIVLATGGELDGLTIGPAGDPTADQAGNPGGYAPRP